MRTQQNPPKPKLLMQSLQMLARPKKRSAVAAAVVDEDVRVKARRLPQDFHRRPSRIQRPHNPRRRRNRGHRRRNAFNLPERLRSKRNHSNERQLIPRRPPVPLNLSSPRARSKPLRCCRPSELRTVAQAIPRSLRGCRIWNRCCAAWSQVRYIVWTPKKPPQVPAYSCFQIPIRSLLTMWNPAKRFASAWEISLAVPAARAVAPAKAPAARVRHSIAA